MISFSYLPIKAVKPTKYEENCFFNRGYMFRIFFHFTDIHSILFVLFHKAKMELNAVY